MSFTNKVVIVTGGSAGIGAATVVQFARDGAKVVIVGRNEENLKAVGEKCQSLNADYHIVKADITNENDLNKIVEETIEKYGQIDILINNAAILRKASILNGESLKIYDEVMNTNFKPIVFLTCLVAPYVIKTRGNIINVSSVGGTFPGLPSFAVYNSSKAAVNTFSVGTALDLAPYGVRVNCISPGPVRTEIFERSGMENVNVDNYKEYLALKRVSEPEEIADLILFLASDKAKGITGSNYICDNGYSICRT